MFYRNTFSNRPNPSKSVKPVQQHQVPQKYSRQEKLRLYQKMQQQRKTSDKVSQIEGTTSSNSTTTYTKYYIQLKQQLVQQDPTIAWISQPLIPIKNQRTRNLYFKKQSYLVTNYYGSDYPRSFWINVMGLNGYLNSSGAVTNRAACMVLTQVSSNVDDSGQKFSDLLYSQQDEVTWGIPVNGAPVTFKLSLDSGQFLQFPLTNPITINFQIRQIGF